MAAIICSTGEYHTISLSDDGVVHSFGRNNYGQLGLRNNIDVSYPNPIPLLPKIKQISCGACFSVCVDYDGMIWAFGENENGQLGTGNKTNFNFPQKILNIPPVLSVSCGAFHTFIITDDSDLWSCGNNYFGQLCLGNCEERLKFTRTAFSNISKVALGASHSLFQNKKGEIYSCGFNKNGECGLRHLESPNTPTLIPNLPPNIMQFVCGPHHSLFLDLEGNVYSVGLNQYGQLGLSNKLNQNELKQIPNIPPIKTISITGYSSYLLDFEGNVWSFGYNNCGQLGHVEIFNLLTPTKIKALKNIQQISYGSNESFHFLAQDYENKIIVTGFNSFGQLAIEEKPTIFSPKEIDPQYFSIWGKFSLQSRPKSARK